MTEEPDQEFLSSIVFSLTDAELDAVLSLEVVQLPRPNLKIWFEGREAGILYVEKSGEVMAFPNEMFADARSLRTMISNRPGRWTADGTDEDSGERPESLPPAAAQFLLYLLSRGKSRDALIGDANERFVRDVATYGRRRAHVLYWSETLRSIGPLVGSVAKRAPWLVALFKWLFD
ncbi:MAG: permease prefix domain 2-containing transporter [Bauldia sp.]